MDLALPTAGIAYASFCVWLTVRIINRRERWAKSTLAGVVVMPLLYVGSFGPACWWASSPGLIDGFPARCIPSMFYPICGAVRHLPRPCALAIEWYATVGADDHKFLVGMDNETRELVIFVPGSRKR